MESEIGTLTKWNDEKGFGFITPKSGGRGIFLHIKEFSREHKRPSQRLLVSYDRETDARGRNYAINVSPLKGHKKVTKVDSQLFFSLILSSTFFAIVATLVVINKLPFIILGVYIMLSAAAFALYKKDKSAAECDQWRTPEKTLHLISLVGGWSGALIAQSKLRHKCKKFSFRAVYWVTVIINCVVLAWFVSPDGAATLHVLIENIH